MVSSEWFKALYDEDCVRVRDLLRAQSSLLGEGLKEDHRRVVEGTSTWRGRTALHVGARRGSVELVTLVLGLCDKGFMRVSLEDLLVAKDGWYKLDALAMAIVNGNGEIIITLAKGSFLKSETNPYEVSSGWEVPVDLPSMEHPLVRDSRHKIWQITEKVMENVEQLRGADTESLKALYTSSRDFNFLPWQEYLFHFTFLMRPSKSALRLDELRHEIFDGTRSSPDLRRFLCTLKDGQGRTAFHVAVDEGTVLQFLRLVPKDSPDLLSVVDRTGKMPLHRAAAMQDTTALRLLLDDHRIGLDAVYTPWEYTEWLWRMAGIDIERVSRNNGVKGYGWYAIYDLSNALHIAIIHKRTDSVRLLLDEKYNAYRAEDCSLDLEFPFTRAFRLRNGERRRLSFEPLQLAAIVGDIAIIEMLLQNRGIRDPGRPSRWPRPSSCTSKNPWPAFHLVAALGEFQLLRLFMDNKNYDITVEDLDQNTPLHHATKGREFEFSVDLIHHISCESAVGSVLDNHAATQETARREDVERQGCIELLLQVGFDIWKTNKAKQAPHPGPDASAEILAWWYNKLAKETIAQQSTLNAASNAISVTATLVATASFIGPLQPPLGFSSVTNQLEVSSQPIRVFIVCDTISFYLAVAAIMSALIPSLPMPQESMMDELRRTRSMVIIAVGFLFPSIISILIAFGAASVAVIPNSPGSWNDGGLTIATASIGGMICLAIIGLFFIRLLRLVFYRNVKIRTLYTATTF